MLHPFPSRTPRALPLPTPRPKLKGLLSHLEWATLPHQYTKCNHERARRAPKSPIVPRPPTPARTPRSPPGLGNHRRESPAARPSTIRQERAFTVTVGADFHRRCAGTPPRHGKGSVTITRHGPQASTPAGALRTLTHAFTRDHNHDRYKRRLRPSPVPPHPHALHPALPDSAPTDENRRPPIRARFARSAPSPSRLVRASTAGAQGPRLVIAKAASRSSADAGDEHRPRPRPPPRSRPFPLALLQRRVQRPIRLMQ